MARVEYPKTSPYSETPQASWFLGNYVHRRIPRNSEDRTIVLETKYEHRPEKLARDLYGNPALWWVFMVRNIGTIRDPIWDFTAGMTIVVPSVSHLRAVLGT